MKVSYYPLGDQAVLLEFEQEVSPEILSDVQCVYQEIKSDAPEWLIEAVPAYASITVHYDLKQLLDAESAEAVVIGFLKEKVAASKNSDPPEQRVVRIPVCYGGEYGPDLKEVADCHQLTPDEVVKRHTDGDYTVYMLGFAPGFPYIGGLDASIATPRKKNPRSAIPAGSVGIAGQQTGVYSIETPGGWQIIGRTPEKLFDMTKNPSFLLRAGDKIEFYPITEKEYEEWQE
ncbi:5-oxoprolinase subunit PxpB [Jeotgalibacillus aurantiacus]|uniref:5-oxoprolinase subunit PxpB n=1 Tax=Jeotgalibacillus aurantiacus TaxID=2763266 RepID=UPI001D0BA6D2|nr:5-oxoprolinase subunit PxpB [Jeotgalibacillus aurantiacus]